MISLVNTNCGPYLVSHNHGSDPESLDDLQGQCYVAWHFSEAPESLLNKYLLNAPENVLTGLITGVSEDMLKKLSKAVRKRFRRLRPDFFCIAPMSLIKRHSYYVLKSK